MCNRQSLLACHELMLLADITCACLHLYLCLDSSPEHMFTQSKSGWTQGAAEATAQLVSATCPSLSERSTVITALLSATKPPEKPVGIHDLNSGSFALLVALGNSLGWEGVLLPSQPPPR